jgi:hypothetical protein
MVAPISLPVPLREPSRPPMLPGKPDREVAVTAGVDGRLSVPWPDLSWLRDPLDFARCGDCNVRFTLFGQLAHLHAVHRWFADELAGWLADVEAD